MRSLWTGLFTDTFLCSVQKQKTNKLVLQTSLHTSYEKPKKLTKADCGKPEAARRAEKEPQDRDDPRIRKVPQGAGLLEDLDLPLVLSSLSDFHLLKGSSCSRDGSSLLLWGAGRILLLLLHESLAI